MGGIFPEGPSGKEGRLLASAAVDFPTEGGLGKTERSCQFVLRSSSARRQANVGVVNELDRLTLIESQVMTLDVMYGIILSHLGLELLRL